MLADNLRNLGRLGLAALILLLPRAASALDRAWLTVSPRSGPVEAFALLLRGDLLMVGTLTDLEPVQKLRDASAEDFLWLRSEGTEHVIRDAALLAPLDELWSSTDARLLAEKDGSELEPEKEEIRRQQEDLDAWKEELRRADERLFDERFELLAIRFACPFEDCACKEEVDLLDEDNRRRQDEVDRSQKALRESQEALDDREDELDEAQSRIRARRHAHDEALRQEVEKALPSLLERAVAQETAQEP